MAKNNNFTVINKQAQELWNDASYGVVKETSRRISEAEKAMSRSQKEAAQVQRDVSARFFQDTEAALINTQKGSVRNPALAELGNELIWGIYHSSATVENAKDRTERRDASIQTSSLEKSLAELYTVIDLGKENDPLFLLEYFGRDRMKFPGQPGGI
jgi:molecular chaperone GrpE (heat shock protein)